MDLIFVSGLNFHQTFANVSMITILILAILYLVAVFQLYRKRQRWPVPRTSSFLFGSLLIMIALSPPTVAYAHHSLQGHMVQHLILGMFAPLFLVLAAPITLLLRSIRVDAAKHVIQFLHSDLVYVISHPLSTLLFNIGGMYLLYLSPLYQMALTNNWLHSWMCLHFMVAGYLFIWSIVGPDHAPRRPSPQFRLVIVFFAIALHTLLAKVMFAYGWPKGTGHSLAEIEAAAKIMFYGGDIAELLLLIAFFKQGFLIPTRNSAGDKVSMKGA